ncbi:helix-turn-helix transcriptional regulator [Parasutterella excrementihominis]|uniref:helix-turn-helix transcriptional regulator n=1 Tax=Parasutterella excrementihominis TaxID=487175 RepID=UPI00265E6223|nr:helix-turn-helix domain-containing protein [Parasutterella excrementihominis]
MINNQNNTEKGGVLSVQESAQYLGVSRSSFWRKAKSDGFPSKVIINNKVGYRPEDLEEWHSHQVANREAKRSGVPTYEYLGKAQFILKCHDLARDCVRMNAIRKGTSILEAERLFEWAFDRLKDSYVKVFPQGLDSENFDYEGKPWKDFIEAKEEIIKLVWPEVDITGLTEEDILRF